MSSLGARHSSGAIVVVIGKDARLTAEFTPPLSRAPSG
jgi:hypothetical protein